MKKFAFLVLISICIFSVSGCKKSGGDGGEKIKVAGIIFQEDHFFRLVRFGMRDAAKEAGVELLEANSDNKPDKEIQLVNTYIARGVDGIVISPLSSKASQTALKRAHEQGIKVVTNNSTIDDGSIICCYVESNQHQIANRCGQAAAKYIQEKLGGKAKVAILAYKSQIPEQSDIRTNGFKEAIAGMEGVEIVAEQDAWLAEMAVQKAGDILTANPDVNVIYCANEGGAIGAVMAVKNAGKAGKVGVFGIGASPQMVDFLLSQDNIMQAIVGQDAFNIGSMAVQACLKAIRGEQIESHQQAGDIFLSREDPDRVRQFKTELAELISKGSR